MYTVSMSRTQYTVSAGQSDATSAEVILRLTPAEGLYLAQRILNQLDLKQPHEISIILSAAVREVAA